MAGKAPQHSGEDRPGEKANKRLKPSAQARQREDHVTDLRSQFVPYGHILANHLVSEFLRYGHLKNVLRMLNLIQPPELDQQCDLILRHLDQVGPQSLMLHLNIAQKSPEDGTTTTQRETTTELGERILTEAEMRLMKKMMGQPHAQSPHQVETAINPAHKPTHDESEATSQSAQPPSAGSSELTAPSQPPLEEGVTICPKTGRPMMDGQYIERRSGIERRQTKDRRVSLDVVFRNRRFGGDRRSGEDRRKNPWTPPPQPDTPS